MSPEDLARIRITANVQRLYNAGVVAIDNNHPAILDSCDQGQFVAELQQLEGGKSFQPLPQTTIDLLCEVADSYQAGLASMAPKKNALMIYDGQPLKHDPRLCRQFLVKNLPKFTAASASIDLGGGQYNAVFYDGLLWPAIEYLFQICMGGIVSAPQAQQFPGQRRPGLSMNFLKCVVGPLMKAHGIGVKISTLELLLTDRAIVPHAAAALPPIQAYATGRRLPYVPQQRAPPSPLPLLLAPSGSPAEAFTAGQLVGALQAERQRRIEEERRSHEEFERQRQAERQRRIEEERRSHEEFERQRLQRQMEFEQERLRRQVELEQERLQRQVEFEQERLRRQDDRYEDRQRRNEEEERAQRRVEDERAFLLQHGTPARGSAPSTPAQGTGASGGFAYHPGASTPSTPAQGAAGTTFGPPPTPGYDPILHEKIDNNHRELKTLLEKRKVPADSRPGAGLFGPEVEAVMPLPDYFSTEIEAREKFLNGEGKAIPGFDRAVTDFRFLKEYVEEYPRFLPPVVLAKDSGTLAEWLLASLNGPGDNSLGKMLLRAAYLDEDQRVFVYFSENDLDKKFKGSRDMDEVGSTLLKGLGFDLTSSVDLQLSFMVGEDGDEGDVTLVVGSSEAGNISPVVSTIVERVLCHAPGLKSCYFTGPSVPVLDDGDIM